MAQMHPELCTITGDWNVQFFRRAAKCLVCSRFGGACAWRCSLQECPPELSAVSPPFIFFFPPRTWQCIWPASQNARSCAMWDAGAFFPRPIYVYIPVLSPLSVCPSLASSVSSGSRLWEGRGGDLINPFAAGHLQAQTWKRSFFFFLPGVSTREGTRPSDECALCLENGNNNGGEEGRTVARTHTNTSLLKTVNMIKCVVLTRIHCVVALNPITSLFRRRAPFKGRRSVKGVYLYNIRLWFTAPWLLAVHCPWRCCNSSGPGPK